MAKTAMFGKMKPYVQTRASLMYGQGQPWWTTDSQGYGVSKFVDSTLPEIVKSSFTAEQTKAFGSLRDATATGSLRKFLKKQNEARGFKGLRLHHASSPKPAFNPAPLK